LSYPRFAIAVNFALRGVFAMIHRRNSMN